MTTHAELNLFTLGAAALGIGATMWVLGLQLGPTTVTVQVPERVIYHPGVGQHFDRSGHEVYWDTPPYTETIPAHTETVNKIGVRQRPNLFGGGYGTGGSPSTDPAVWILGGPLAAFLFGGL